MQTPATPFIGRERQVAQAGALLRQPAVRLLTLTGPGGIGKTRLALAVAAALRGEFPTGVVYVPLAALADAKLVLPAIGEALGVREAGRSDLLERLQAAIDQQKLLLVLDNFEQVIAAAPDVAALLAACPQLNVLVTSREVLRIGAEHNLPVPPLALPDLDTLPPLPALARVEAVHLFVSRAQAAQPDFALTAENAVAVAGICRRLDGLPLAIELAAARLPLLPPAAMLTRLDRRLPLLTGGVRDAPLRHQTLRAAIGWSYDLLEPQEQQLFRRLGVFAGGCTLEAAAVVGSAALAREGSDEELLRALASLVDKSLLGQRPAEADPGRLYMLETIREYALEQLAASGEAEPLLRAHARYFLALAEEAETALSGPDQPAWLKRLEQEHDNLRAALAWAISQADYEMAARLAASLGRFWLTHGHIREGRRWLEAALAGGGAVPPAIRAQALNAAGRLALRQGDYTTAQTELLGSLALGRVLGDRKGEMQVLNNLGLMALYQNDLAAARQYLEQSLAGWRILGDKPGIAQVLNRLGLVVLYQYDFDLAAALYEESLALARTLHDKFAVAAPLHNLGQMAHHQGEDHRAHRLLVESFLIVRQMDDKPNIAVWLADFAGVWATQGQPERAARLFGAAQALRDNMGVVMYEAQRRAYQQDVDRGAAQLDAAAWAAAWTAGQGLSLEAAGALAIEALPSPAADPPGNPYDLTEREFEVLRLLVADLTYAQIAERLMLSFHTVHAHLRSIYRKLGVKSRYAARRVATEHGLV
jgi:non-specific serine/threonine protein kinase